MQGKSGMRILLVGVLGLLMLGGFAGVASAAPGWYLCEVEWAGCGGNGVYIILSNPLFLNKLGTSFPDRSIMVSAPTDTSTANRYLVTALSAIGSQRQVLVYVEPVSFSVIGGMYVIAQYRSGYPTP